jgi:hypothetical protein
MEQSWNWHTWSGIRLAGKRSCLTRTTLKAALDGSQNRNYKYLNVHVTHADIICGAYKKFWRWHKYVVGLEHEILYSCFSNNFPLECANMQCIGIPCQSQCALCFK